MLSKITSKRLLVSFLLFSIVFSYGDNTSSNTATSTNDGHERSVSQMISEFHSNKKIEKVIVTGIGINQDKAIRNASKTAVQQVVGMYVVSDVIMKNSQLIKDEVLSTSNGFVKSFKVLNKRQDEDGLFEIEAEVEVEINKLTKRLGDLNVALKYVGTDSLKAISFDKFASSKDFKKMAEKVIFEPLKDNKIWELKIVDFKHIDENSDYRKPSSTRYDDLLPFMLSIKASASKEYYNSVMQFIEKNSQEEVYVKKTSRTKQVIRFENLQLTNTNTYGVKSSIRKVYMTDKKMNILFSLSKRYKQSMNYKFVVSLYNQEELFKQSLFGTYFNRLERGFDFPMSTKISTKLKQEFKVNELKYRRTPPLTSMAKNFTFRKNNLTFGIILLLSEDDIAQLKDMKIEFVN